MHDLAFSLADLLGPVSPGEFFSAYWEQRPLAVRRGRPDYYDSVLTLGDVDRLLFSHEQRYPAVRLAKVGAKFAPATFTEDIPWGGSTFNGVVEADRLLAEYRAGATIVVDALHRTWKPLTLLCKNLEVELNHPTQVNIYLTPANAQGFGQHYDTHDAFLLQIAGRKHWRIYESALHLPLASQPWDPERYPVGELIEEIDFQPGDLIYMPRGFVHEGMTSDSHSLHVTLGIGAYTWIDVLAEALNRCRRDPRFRESLPVGFNRLDGAGPAMQAKLEELARALAEAGTAEELFAQLDERFVNSRRPVLEGQIASAGRLEALSLATVMRRPAHIVYRVDANDEAVRLRFHGKQLSFPAFVEPAVRHVADHAEFRIGDLPDVLDDQSKLVFSRRLAAEGFLWPAGA